MVGADFEVVQCGRCTFIRQQQILNDLGMSKLYNEWISADSSLMKKQASDISLYAGYARQVEAIGGLLKRKPADVKVLDFGMGWGHWCRMAMAYGYEVYGFEIASDRLAYARKFGLQVTGDKADLAGERFDFINSEQVFEHVPRPRTDLDYLVSKLNRGGILRISVPNGSGVADVVKRPNWRPTHDAIHPLEHINCFTNKTLIYLAKNGRIGADGTAETVGSGASG